MRLLLCIFILLSYICVATSTEWKTSLERNGYIVQQGMFDFFSLETCKNDMDTCYAQNPLTPYGLIYLPRSPFEIKENYTGWCAHNLCKRNSTMGAAWRVAKGETILLTGRTPPKSIYWGFTNYLYTRFNPPGWKPPLIQTLEKKLDDCPGGGVNGSRCEIFAGINDPLNMETVNVSSEESFNVPFAMLLTWDSESETNVASILSQSTFPYSLNFNRFPGSVLRLGVTLGDEDDFTHVVRVEGIANEDDRKKFYAGEWGIQVYRISPSVAKDITTFHPSFEKTMRRRETKEKEEGANKTVTHQQLRLALAELEAGVRIKHSHAAIARQNFDSFVQDSGYECLHQGVRCQGDCRDTIYAKATLLVSETICNMTHMNCPETWRSELSKNDINDSFIVIGVSHSKTGMAKYSSVAAYDWPKLAPVGDITDWQLENSAAYYLGDQNPATKYLYAVKFARVCRNPEELCVEIPASSNDPEISALSYDSPVIFIERCYLNPLTNSGPAVSETILPILLHTRSSHYMEII